MNNLTPFLCSIHTHTAFCDGKNTMEEMAEAAYKAGVRYYGVSGHSHTPVPQDKDFVLPYDMTDTEKRQWSLENSILGKWKCFLDWSGTFVLMRYVMDLIIGLAVFIICSRRTTDIIRWI